MSTLVQRRRAHQTQEERLVLLRVALYNVLQSVPEFVHELEELHVEVQRLSRRATNERLRRFADRWRLPPRYAISDLRAALRWRIESPDRRLRPIDLVRRHAVGRELRGIEMTRTIKLTKTIEVIYNPVLHDRRDVKIKLEKTMDKFRRAVLRNIKAVDRQAALQNVRVMPPRWSERELERLASRWYQHSFLNRSWKDITDNEERDRGKVTGSQSPESLRSSSARFARRLGLPVKKGKGPR